MTTQGVIRDTPYDDRHTADQATCGETGLRIERFDTWLGATRLPSVDTFLDAEPLPLGKLAGPALRARARSAPAPFVAADGAITAPIEAHLITAT